MPEADSRIGPDGYQYGVRFGDGSVRANWNGATQRRQADDFAEWLRVHYPGDRYEVVRRRAVNGPWEPV